MNLYIESHLNKLHFCNHLLTLNETGMELGNISHTKG